MLITLGTVRMMGKGKQVYMAIVRNIELENFWKFGHLPLGIVALVCRAVKRQRK